MTVYEVRGTAAVPIGREAEIDRILRSLDARSGPPRALLVLGETGTGKSHVLRFAEETAAARGTRVLSLRGWGTEKPQPFASLHRLLLPVLDEPDALPEHRRPALRTAFESAADAGPREHRAVGEAVLALVDRLARAAPVLLAVDDVQDCDRASLNVLFSLTRRLTDQPVTMLFTACGEAAPAGVPADLPVLPLGPLPPRAAAGLLDAQPDAVTGRPRLDLLRQAEGNPLAIVELNLATRVGAGSAPIGPEPGRTSRIQQMFAARLGALPERTQRALLYAAAASREEELPVVMAALGTSDLTVWAPAEKAGLISIADGRLAFGNPLIRTAAFHRQTARLRQRAHRDLAAAADRTPARRAWYLAAAAIGPDEAVARALEEAAAEVRQAGDRFDSAQALEQAARLSGSDDDRARRLAGAMAAASDLGDPEWVRDLYARFTRVNRDPELRSVAACAMGGALTLLSFQREAFDLLLGVWRQSPPRTAIAAFALTALAADIARQSGLPEHRREVPRMLDHARRLAEMAREGEKTQKAQAAEKAQDAEQESRKSPRTPGGHGDHAGRREAVRHDGFSELAGPGVLASLEAFVSAGLDPGVHAGGTPRRLTAPPFEPLDGAGSPTRLLVTASVAYHTDESELCAEMYRQADTARGARGGWGPRAWTLPARVDNLIGMGRWAEAETLIEEGRSDAAVHRLPRVDMDLEALEVTLRALRGESLPEIPFTGPHWRSVSLDENRATRARMLRACGLTALARGEADRAFRHLRALFGEDGSPLDPFLSPRSLGELAAAAQRTGRQEEAARVLGRVREHQGDRPTTRMTLLLHHAAALVDEETDPEQHFRLALVNPEADTWPLERAQARLHYAIWLRRRRRPLEARAQLTAALEVATRFDARNLAESARCELRATGVADAPASVDRLSELTAQQRQIARLVADGLSNREIGERLFLSPRTVGSHLYNVYPKLGISSRHQLRDLLRDL
ncbi:AAA family ATPase [Streptomyces sp. NPDC006551]|uniref:helix-turn-helix transcriptional regulator n=1 Tax=Streptomyces sp. NPDC006551 TaxID=3157178 RepID=UPI0033A2146C